MTATGQGPRRAGWLDERAGVRVDNEEKNRIKMEIERQQ